MKVLWFEVTVPGRYKGGNLPIGGWQDSLEYVVRRYNEIELYIAFESNDSNERKIIDGVTYIPIVPCYSLLDKIKNKWTWKNSRDKLMPLATKVVEDVKPDIIHVFGSEWCWGQVQLYTNIPVVIHMQGSIPPYYNARFPPSYSDADDIMRKGLNVKKQIGLYLARHKYITWVWQEEKTLSCVKYYMGKTTWDRNIVRLYNPQAKYYYCSEALRPSFYESSIKWECREKGRIRIITVGANYWKGLDVILKTAHLLKQRNVDFEWFLCGNSDVCRQIEEKENLRYEDNNVKLMGFVGPEDLPKLLLSCDMYVHTAYIDNSPNAVCEAQLLGMPVIATYTGGIPSLIENGKNGILIPTNDPFTLAITILDLATNKNFQAKLGKASREMALERHSPDTIYRDLMRCYNSILG